MNAADVHTVLTLHRYRTAELYAEADRERLAREVTRSRWLPRIARRQRAATRAPAMS
ncbi:hypothetical protein [Phytohabitans aurantiacus]|jgi:hypothetical protein|uniref:Uncharacterized protein n=1 Tax=Phytohabitans aurantiacus TaxID=3016789 RepID=A0ABQ5RA08_9ACTN|nr:hypothetical protein [Phytohabitans aurantiacus]GLI03048.1 hypothetical protein Pa4123_83260 [Phytohabitans aurantiacus]